MTLHHIKTQTSNISIEMPHPNQKKDLLKKKNKRTYTERIHLIYDTMYIQNLLKKR